MSNPNVPRLYDRGVEAFHVFHPRKQIGYVHTADCPTGEGYAPRQWAELHNLVYGGGAHFCDQCDSRAEWDRWEAMAREEG